MSLLRWLASRAVRVLLDSAPARGGSSSQTLHHHQHFHKCRCAVHTHARLPFIQVEVAAATCAPTVGTCSRITFALPHAQVAQPLPQVLLNLPITTAQVSGVQVERFCPCLLPPANFNFMIAPHRR